MQNWTKYDSGWVRPTHPPVDLKCSSDLAQYPKDNVNVQPFSLMCWVFLGGSSMLDGKICKTPPKDSSCQCSSEQMVNINNLWSSFSLTCALHFNLHWSNAGPSQFSPQISHPCYIEKATGKCPPRWSKGESKWIKNEGVVPQKLILTALPPFVSTQRNVFQVSKYHRNLLSSASIQFPLRRECGGSELQKPCVVSDIIFIKFLHINPRLYCVWRAVRDGSFNEHAHPFLPFFFVQWSFIW